MNKPSWKLGLHKLEIKHCVLEMTTSVHTHVNSKECDMTVPCWQLWPMSWCCEWRPMLMKYNCSGTASNEVEAMISTGFRKVRVSHEDFTWFTFKDCKLKCHNEIQESNLGCGYSAHSVFLLYFSSDLTLDNRPFGS